MLLAGLLVLVGLLLLFVWLMGGRKNMMWRNLGLITVGIGILLLGIGYVLFLTTN